MSPELPLSRIEVTDANGMVLTTPNALVGCVLWGSTGEQPTTRSGEPINELSDGAKVFNPLALVPRPDVPSMLSGEPSVSYFADDVKVDVTPDELYRLIARELTPEEHRLLLGRFGMFWEIDGHYYDPSTGDSYRVMDQREQAVEVRRPGPTAR
jgi:hypothetical protein